MVGGNKIPPLCLLAATLVLYSPNENVTALCGRRNIIPQQLVFRHGWKHIMTSTVQASYLKISNEHNNNDDTSAPVESKRRSRNNKYEKFSKILSVDPLEALLEESVSKNQQLIEEENNRIREKQLARHPHPTAIPPSPSLEFPDTKDIDPYDPQTFGYIQIGTIVGAHGVHGWLKLQSCTDFVQERLLTSGLRHVKAANRRSPRPMVLIQGRHRHADEYLIQLANVINRDDAQQLRGAILYIRQEQKDDITASVLEEEEFLVEDLVGLEVFLQIDNDKNKQFVGTVAGVVFAEDLCSTPGLGHDYLELVLPRGIGGTTSWKDERVLVPMVPQIVTRVNVKDREIYIDPPTGLLDLTYIREEKTRIRGFLPLSER